MSLSSLTSIFKSSKISPQPSSTSSKIRFLQAKIDTIIRNSGNLHADKKESVENFVKTSQALALLQPEKNSGAIQHEYLLKNPHFNSVYQAVAQKVMDDSPSYVMRAGAPSGYNPLCRDYYDWCQEAHSLQVAEGEVQPFNNNVDVRAYLALTQTGSVGNVTQVSLWAQYAQRTNTTTEYLNKLPNLIGTDLPPSSDAPCTQIVPLPQFDNNYSLQAFLSHSTLGTCDGIKSFAIDTVTNFNPNGPAPIEPGNDGHSSSDGKATTAKVVLGIGIPVLIIGTVLICKKKGWFCCPPVTIEQKHTALVKKFDKVITDMKKIEGKEASNTTGLLGEKTLRAKHAEANKILAELHKLQHESEDNSEKISISQSFNSGRAELSKFDRYKLADKVTESEIPLTPSRTRTPSLSLTTPPNPAVTTTVNAKPNSVEATTEMLPQRPEITKTATSVQTPSTGTATPNTGEEEKKHQTPHAK